MTKGDAGMTRWNAEKVEHGITISQSDITLPSAPALRYLSC